MNHPLLSNIKILRLLLLVFVASFTSAAFALLIPVEDKTIRVRATSNALSVDIEPIKTSFWVNEKIRLRSKGNKPYYLYLFNVDPTTGEAIMILPNKLQRDNYYGHQGYIVPNRDIEFYSDRPGKEQMIMVASTRPINMGMDRYKSIGDFVTGKSSSFEKALGIRFNAPKPEKVNPDILVKTFDITIAGNRQVQQQSFLGQFFSSSTTQVAQDINYPITFISSANNEYIDGEQFNLVFGANQEGYVHLYTIDPSGAYDFLKIVRVDGKNLESFTIQAAPPYGRHTLVALFENKDVINHKRLDDISLNADKSMFVVNKSKRAVAMHPIFIKELDTNR